MGRHGVIVGGVLKKSEDEKNKLRMGGGSWTINLDEINNENIQVVEYLTKKAKYIIHIDKAVECGFERMLGGERKLVVPLGYWTTINREGRDGKN